MGIKDIDNLISDDVVELYPEWPVVRCTECGTTYPIEALPDVFLAEGDCPKCHNVYFNTSYPIPNAR